MPVTPKSPPNVRRLLEQVSDARYFDEGLLRADFQLAADDQRLFVITGGNASGKTFLAKLISGWSRREHEGLETMNVGMSFRTTPGIGRAFVYGSESDQSTGLNSYRAIEGALGTCRQRTTPHILILDEPDIGLSEDFQGGVGKLLAEFAIALPAQTVAFGVVTHSRRLLRHLVPLKPHHLRCDDKLTLAQVVDREPPDMTPAEMEAAKQRGLTRWRALTKIIERA